MGYYKAHPEVPQELSEKAKSFIKRCFEPDPDKRATAAQLLEDPFLGKVLLSIKFLFMLFIDFIVGQRQKTVRLNNEYTRSVSVPVDKLVSRHPGHNSAPNQTPTTPDPE